MQINYELIKHFGPSVFKVRIPENTILKINEFIDNVVEDKTKSENLNVGRGLAGDVTQEFKLDRKIAEESGWINFLTSCAAKWVMIETGNKISQFKLIETWVVRQFENEYNPMHCHTGHISGAGFLKVPKSFGKPVQDDKIDYRGGNLELIHGNRMFLSEARYEIIPKVGDFYFFPHYLMHTVYPFKNTKEERRSISFNAKIDDKVFNIFGT